LSFSSLSLKHHASARSNRKTFRVTPSRLSRYLFPHFFISLKEIMRKFLVCSHSVSYGGFNLQAAPLAAQFVVENFSMFGSGKLLENHSSRSTLMAQSPRLLQPAHLSHKV